MSSPRRTIMAASGGGGFPEGAMYEVGYNAYIGQDGTNNAPYYNATWEQVGTDTDWAGTMASSYAFFMIVKNDGTMWHTGVGTSGQGGGTASTDSPVQVGAESHWRKTANSVAAGNGQVVAIQNNGALWAWGSNWKGHLGDGTTTSRSSPIQVSSPALSWSVVAAGDRHSMAISTAGTLWATGFNLYGCLGQGDTTDRSNLTQVGSGTDWSKIASGDAMSLAVKTNGQLWSWGNNNVGQLGLGDTTHRSSPVQVGGTDWADVFGSGQTNTFMALKTDGTLWSCGGGAASGQGGSGTTPVATVSSPVQVGVATDWLRVTNTNNNAIGIKTNGEVWSWGMGMYGQLGHGPPTTNSGHKWVPTKVPDFEGVHEAGIAYNHSRIIV